MDNALLLRVSLALLGGFILGLIFVWLRVRSGLTAREWLYLRAFYQALRDGTYDDHEVDDESKGVKIMETKIDWKSKLTSRKFWLALAGLVSGLLLAFRVDENTVNDVTGIIMAGASVIAYVIGEGLADAAGAKATVYTEAAADVIEKQQLPVQKEPPDDPQEDDLK